MQDELGRATDPQDPDVVHLPTSGTPRAAAVARWRSGPSTGSGSTWTTTSLPGSSRSMASSIALATACPCARAASGSTPTTTSAKWRPLASRMRRRRKLTVSPRAAIAWRTRSWADSGRGAVHQRRARSPASGGPPRRARDRPRAGPRSRPPWGSRRDEHAGRSARPPSRACRARSAARSRSARGSCSGGRPGASSASGRRRSRSRGPRPPARTSVCPRGGGARASRTDSAITAQAHEHEQRALAEGRQVFGLAVAIGMASIGGPRGDAHAEEGQQRSHQVAGRVESVGDQGKAVSEQADDELDPHEQTRRRARTRGRCAAARSRLRRLICASLTRGAACDQRGARGRACGQTGARGRPRVDSENRRRLR